MPAARAWRAAPRRAWRNARAPWPTTRGRRGRSRGSAITASRVAARDPGRGQRLARQIEPAHARRPRPGRAGCWSAAARGRGGGRAPAPARRSMPKILHRQPADGAGHPVAVEVELAQAGRADVLVDVHLHAVDHGQEVVLLQAEALRRLGQERASAPAGRRRRARRGRRASGSSLTRRSSRVGPGRRRCRRPRGRRRRWRTSPRARPAAAAAWRRRTSCRTPVARSRLRIGPRRSRQRRVMGPLWPPLRAIAERRSRRRSSCRAEQRHGHSASSGR